GWVDPEVAFLGSDEGVLGGAGGLLVGGGLFLRCCLVQFGQGQADGAGVQGMAAVQEFEQYPGHGTQGVFHLTSEVVTFVLVQVGEGGHGGRVAGPLQQGGAVDLFPGTAPKTYGHGDGQGLFEFEDTGAQLERVGGPNAAQGVGEPAQPACVQPGVDAGDLEFGA